ncbi:hypothetical protein [Nocardia sp. NBC_00403]
MPGDPTAPCHPALLTVHIVFGVLGLLLGPIGVRLATRAVTVGTTHAHA